MHPSSITTGVNAPMPVASYLFLAICQILFPPIYLAIMVAVVCLISTSQLYKCIPGDYVPSQCCFCILVAGKTCSLIIVIRVCMCILEKTSELYYIRDTNLETGSTSNIHLHFLSHLLLPSPLPLLFPLFPSPLFLPSPPPRPLSPSPLSPQELNPGVHQYVCTYLQHHSVWTKLDFWKTALYSAVQAELVRVYTELEVSKSNRPLVQRNIRRVTTTCVENRPEEKSEKS